MRIVPTAISALKSRQILVQIKKNTFFSLVNMKLLYIQKNSAFSVLLTETYTTDSCDVVYLVCFKYSYIQSWCRVILCNDSTCHISSQWRSCGRRYNIPGVVCPRFLLSIPAGGDIGQRPGRILRVDEPGDGLGLQNIQPVRKQR